MMMVVTRREVFVEKGRHKDEREKHFIMKYEVSGTGILKKHGGVFLYLHLI